MRRAFGGGLRALPVAGWDALGRALNRELPGARGIAQVGDKAHKLAAGLGTVRWSRVQTDL